MTLKTQKATVETAISKTKDIFNKKSVKNAMKTFSEFADAAFKRISELSETASSQSAKILELDTKVYSASEELKKAQAKIEYSNIELKKSADTIKRQRERIAKFRERTRKPDIKLENGNILEREVKWNGTELHVEKTPEGRKVGYEVISADEKIKRSGVFDSVTQRRVLTTSANPKEKTIITYDIAGNTENIFKENVNLPKLLDTRVKTLGDTRVLTQMYSDGTTVITKKGNGWGEIRKQDKDQNLMEYFYEKQYYNTRRTTNIKYKNNSADTIIRKEEPLNQNGSYSETKQKIAKDLENDPYVSEVNSVNRLRNLKGKVTKIDKFGDLEEFSFKADIINSQIAPWFENFARVDGVCHIKKSLSGDKYSLVSKEFILTSNSGEKYIIEFDSDGFIRNIRNSQKANNALKKSDVTSLINALDLNSIFRV